MLATSTWSFWWGQSTLPTWTASLERILPSQLVSGLSGLSRASTGQSTVLESLGHCRGGALGWTWRPPRVPGPSLARAFLSTLPFFPTLVLCALHSGVQPRECKPHFYPAALEGKSAPDPSPRTAQGFGLCGLLSREHLVVYLGPLTHPGTFPCSRSLSSHLQSLLPLRWSQGFVGCKTATCEARLWLVKACVE